MAPEKVTVMILNVDLKCSCCYKKVKKVLCKFPQIRDQMFDEEKNKVTITVVCCDPEKIRDKLCCKGGKAIQSIEIVENKPKKPIEKPENKPKIVPVPVPVPEKPKPDTKPPQVVVPVPQPVEKPKPAPPKVDPPKPAPPKVDPPKPAPPKVDPPKPDPPKKPDPAPIPPVVPQPGPVIMPDPTHVYPPAFPVSVCCQECYEGRGGGPCHYGYGRPVPPPPGPCYDGYGYQYVGYRPCYVSRCDYFSEENPQGCSIM